MTSLVRRLVITGALLALSVQLALAQEFLRAQPEEVGLSSERLERLSDAMQTYVDDGHLAGAVAIVVRRGKVAYLEALVTATTKQARRWRQTLSFASRLKRKPLSAWGC